MKDALSGVACLQGYHGMDSEMDSVVFACRM